jgi:Stage II sporulation protein E (SpoIIE)
VASARRKQEVPVEIYALIRRRLGEVRVGLVVQELPLAEELSVVFARMSGLLLSEETVGTAVELVTALATDAIPGAVGGGRRALFGLPTTTMSVAEEFLEPGDWLTLYTDGITEARDEAGNFFGEERLIDFLRREAASDHPPPETVRRLVHSVMRHQRGVLQDDATVLLARWDAQPRPAR